MSQNNIPRQIRCEFRDLEENQSISAEINKNAPRLAADFNIREKTTTVLKLVVDSHNQGWCDLRNYLLSKVFVSDCSGLGPVFH